MTPEEQYFVGLHDSICGLPIDEGLASDDDYMRGVEHGEAALVDDMKTYCHTYACTSISRIEASLQQIATALRTFKKYPPVCVRVFASPAVVNMLLLASDSIEHGEATPPTGSIEIVKTDCFVGEQWAAEFSDGHIEPHGFEQIEP